MTKQEFKNIVQGLISVYTQNNFLSDIESITVWYDILHNYDYMQMQKAVFDYIRSNHYPPTPSDLIKNYDDITVSLIQKQVYKFAENVENMKNVLTEKEQEREKLREETEKQLVNELKEYSKYFDCISIFELYGLKKINLVELYASECKKLQNERNASSIDQNKIKLLQEELSEWESRALAEFHATSKGSEIEKLDSEIEEIKRRILCENAKKKRFTEKLNEIYQHEVYSLSDTEKYLLESEDYTE